MAGRLEPAHEARAQSRVTAEGANRIEHMEAAKAANLAVRFLLELAALGALGYWGATVQAGAVARTALAVALPFTAALFWGLFVAPRARVVLPTGVRMLLGLVVFACAAAALVDRGRVRLGAGFAALAVVNVTLMLVWRQDRVMPRDTT